MRWMARRWVWLGAAACLGGVPAWAADEAGDLSEMKALVRQLQHQVSAQQEQLEFQGKALARVQTEARAVRSGPASFLDTIELGGWVAGSYLYNFENPRGDSLAGANAGLIPAYPFHPDANSLSLDQLWFELERPISQEHRAGFRADITYGKTAGLLSGVTSGDGLSGNDFDVYQAYVQYLAPVGGGVTFRFGKFATLIGAEVAQSPQNFNITRGHVYNLFQPITHTGILASSDRGPFSVALGLVNETRSFPAADVDRNNDKALLWSLGYGRGAFSASFNGTYGASDSGQGDNTLGGDKELILDLILGWDPSERFSAYVNADRIISENSRPTNGAEFDGYGISVAGRYALTERLGFALRGEWVDLDIDAPGSGLTVWGLTGTLDYLLIDALKLRSELRYDDAGASDVDDKFFDNRGAKTGIATEQTQLVGGVEVIYSY